MNYKLIEDKNGTIVLKGKRYRMNKLEYTKDDLIDLQNDYDLLYNKLEAQDKIINTQALEIARLKEQNKHIEQWWKETNVIIRNDKSLAINDNAMEYILELEQRIDKAIEYIGNVLCNSKAQVRNDISGKEIDNLIEILEGDKENE